MNQGDQGLIEFFTRAYMTLLPSGRFVLEPQPWNSYAKAARLSSELKESYACLKLRPDDFERILLEEIGFERVEKLSEESGEGERTSAPRDGRARGEVLTIARLNFLQALSGRCTSTTRQLDLGYERPSLRPVGIQEQALQSPPAYRSVFVCWCTCPVNLFLGLCQQTVHAFLVADQ